MLVTRYFCNQKLFSLITINGTAYNFNSLIEDWQDSISLANYLEKLDFTSIDTLEITLGADSEFISSETFNSYLKHYGISFIDWYIRTTFIEGSYNPDWLNAGLSLLASAYSLEHYSSLAELADELNSLLAEATMHTDITEFVCEVDLDMLYSDEEQDLIVEGEVTNEDIDRAIDYINSYYVVTSKGELTHPSRKALIDHNDSYPAFVYFIR